MGCALAPLENLRQNPEIGIHREAGWVRTSVSLVEVVGFGKAGWVAYVELVEAVEKLEMELVEADMAVTGNWEFGTSHGFKRVAFLAPCILG